MGQCCSTLSQDAKRPCIHPEPAGSVCVRVSVYMCVCLLMCERIHVPVQGRETERKALEDLKGVAYSLQT